MALMNFPARGGDILKCCIRLTFTAAFLAGLLCPPTLAEAADFTVAFISDGDTLTLRARDGHPVRVRLAGIDAPEMAQVGGIEAKEAVRKMFLIRKDVRAEWRGKDSYGRQLRCYGSAKQM